ncbi:MAG: hypothetical protein O3A02_05745 [bacterium]|nr:hypothetical protein [bacterium]
MRSRRSEGLELGPLYLDPSLQRSQDLPELFCPTGSVWWARSGVLRRARTFRVSHRAGWKMPWQRGIDIDTEEDWALVELLGALLRLRPAEGEGST